MLFILFSKWLVCHVHLYLLDVCQILIYLFLKHCNVPFGGWSTHTAVHKVKRLTRMPSWASSRLSRTEEGLPCADAKLQVASEYSVIGHILLLELFL